MSQFQQRYCAFIDILGFTERVKSLENQWDSDVYERLRSCLTFMHDEQHESSYSADLPIYVEVDGEIFQRELGDPRLTYVSDCLVISTERSPNGFKALCQKVTKIWIDLLWDGYLCRGGISAGPLIHESSCIMGSAYMNAYQLEAKASSPRVIIDPSLEELYSDFPSSFPLHPPTIERAQDGYLYLRYLPFQFFPPYAFNWSSYLLRARQVVVSGLLHTTPSVQAKFAFLKEEFNFAVQQFGRFLDPAVRPIE
ncbi:hypothetical protein [Ralstonia mannitolilytica]|uniref:hypothetical protein n=1 Tax=Ralstonia mannitolilytica TaxID=105219 RepID=UPI000CEE2BFA|nr:hypothetical protein [Ralstonia mannitolilytica]